MVFDGRGLFMGVVCGRRGQRCRGLCGVWLLDDGRGLLEWAWPEGVIVANVQLWSLVGVACEIGQCVAVAAAWEGGAFWGGRGLVCSCGLGRAWSVTVVGWCDSVGVAYWWAWLLGVGVVSVCGCGLLEVEAP